MRPYCCLCALLVPAAAFSLSDVLISSPGFLATGAFGAGLLARPLLDSARSRQASQAICQLANIRVRPGSGKYGVGLICVQDVPVGGRICGCEAKNSREVALSSLGRLPVEVRSAVHELFDGVDQPPGTCMVPTE